MTDKTIKELADELGVPKSKINYQVSKLNSDWIVILNGIKHLKPQAQQSIKESLGVQLNTKLNSDLNTFEHQFEQLSQTLNGQLKEKDLQITQLQKLLDQQQQLTLQSNKRIEQLENQIQLLQAPEKEEPVLDPVTSFQIPKQEPDKKWWHFLRRNS